MGFIATGLLISGAFATLCAALFSYEARRGTRFLPEMRRHADYFVLRTMHRIRHLVHYLTVHVVRQVAHYSVHIVLSSALAFMRNGERALRNIMRTNKTLARSAERERASRTKLEEIALHKMENALSEKERAIHKERALNG
jgi:hypothetical protein